MKHFLLVFLFLAVTVTSKAADGYDISIRFTDAADQKIYLAHYYGKALPTIYRVDSAMVDKAGNARLRTDDKIIGGIYLLIMQDNKSYVDFLLDNGQKLQMTATVAKFPLGVTFVNNRENDQFIKYVGFLNDIGKQEQALYKQFAGAKTKADSNALEDKIKQFPPKVAAYRNETMKQFPNTLLYNIFKALEQPKAPDTKDKDAAYRQYKAHYWDNYNFADERLVYTPLLDARLDEYFKKLVLSDPDSFNKDADKLLKKAAASKENFKYVMHWLTGYAEHSNIMGMDAVFVHLVETYHMRGAAFWLSQATLDKYIDRARKIAPNVIGNKAPDMEMTGLDGKTYNISDFKAKYTLLVFWSPDCSHCKEEIPRVDSVYHAEGLAAKGVKMIGFNTIDDTVLWKKLIEEKHLKDWVHVHDPEKKTKFRSLYDVYGTPSIYLLDEQKIIRGKKLDHANIAEVVKIIGEIENSIKNKG